MYLVIYIVFFLNILLSQGIYLDSKKDFSYYFVSSYMKHNDTHQIYNYNFNIKLIKDNLELNVGYNMDKQLPENDLDRENEYMVYNLKYYLKNKRIITGFSISQYNNWNDFDNVNTYSFVLSREFHSYPSGLIYYPYIEYEQYKEKTDNFNPNYTYIGCIIRDDDLFVEPFMRISNDDSNEKFTGIKLGIEMY